MNDRLYPILLKNVEQKKFGVNLISIITPKKQGEVVVNATKLLVTYNGEVQDPIECQSVSVKCCDGTIMLDITLPVEDGNSQIELPPQAESIIPTSKKDIFILQGDDLESLELLSHFRKDVNHVQKTEKDELIARTIESGTFDIQDLTSIENAILDIITQERTLIDEGYKVFKVSIPRFDYENTNNFKLIESVVLIKQTIEVVENK